MPTEKFEKSKLYYVSTEDGEYKELGLGTIEFDTTEVEEKNKKEWEKLKKLYDNTGFTAEFEVKLKKYSKKRFKKLLMARGIQRNEAEIYARIAGDKKSHLMRNLFGLLQIHAEIIANQTALIIVERMKKGKAKEKPIGMYKN